MKIPTCLLCVLTAAAIAGCHNDTVKPLPGQLVVELSAPTASDRAISFVLVGEQSDVESPQGSPYRVFASLHGHDTTQVLVVSRKSEGFTQTSLVVITVADTKQVDRYSAQVLEIAGEDYSLRNAADYSLRVIRP